MSEFSLTKNPSAALVRDLRKALVNHQYETDGADVVVPKVNIRAGGVFTSRVLRHPMVAKAIEAGDKVAETVARYNAALRPEAQFEAMMHSADHNQIPDAGISFLLNLLFHSGTSKVGTWYHGPFKTNWTAFTAAKSNWAGGTSGPLATELQAAEYDEGIRQAAQFATATSGTTITASAPTRFTLATGVSGIDLYGSTLQNVQTVNYDAQDKVLLAAARFGTAKSGLGASDKIDIEYEITGSST